MKLTESQSESFELLYASICNGLLYAEDLLNNTTLRGSVSPLVTKLRWMKTALELKIPASNRKSAREDDHLFFDELLRCATHMGAKDKKKLEEFINKL
jgi:hypothetical protein